MVDEGALAGRSANIVGVAWLLREDDVLASLEEATGWRQRVRGVIARPSLEGALLLRPAAAVHTLGVRFALDVAYCDSSLVVLDVVTMRPWRIGRPRRRARIVIEAPAGAFERWGLQVGDQLEVRS